MGDYDIDRLYEEVNIISRRVGVLKSVANNTEDPEQREIFQKQIDQLQQKAMSYLEKIKKLEKE